ncbi:hypothetical protein [Mucilaginibacter phyllosphaerae]|uniref:Uncharacterized protein n=1 Tax=Mucilaginibacter phyllosphaerae TaxID=1812349 RepID=A0A4Y8A623_9SPHI|nr:hypothetical protein [Mucilaginibacter phyllosphaerae]MBB3971095.1 hypothetical protein [Mucilaginibacter phyllosphaerae]TEW63830.1 hypothetical protein E2R65_18875 [Mucilaginibacter phyllosphaerae]GGH22445.1 hypothetical protein GCM10007352_35750 [Mucilaginibacter phyllosphaerae]
MKLISPKLHGIIDYALIVFLFFSPVLFAMPKHVATYTYLLATAQLVLTVITDYSFGMFRMVKLRVHQIIEIVLSIAMVTAAFTLFEYDERTQPYYAGLGVFWFIIAVFTDYSKSRDGIKAPIL